MARRQSDRTQPQEEPLTWMWVVDEVIPGLPTAFKGAIVDFDTNTGIRVITPWEVKQLNLHRLRLRPLSSREAAKPASAARAAARPSARKSARKRAPHLKLKK